LKSPIHHYRTEWRMAKNNPNGLVWPLDPWLRINLAIKNLYGALL